MGLFQRLYIRWRRIDPDSRRHIKQTATWVTGYLIVGPLSLYFMLIAVYDIQTEAALRATVPEEVNDKNYQEWLKKQRAQGRFLDENQKL